MRNFLNLLRLLKTISKYQLLTGIEGVKLPTSVKLLGHVLVLLFYPIGLLKTQTESFGVRLKSCLKQLGPIYIKFGQTLSTRPDLVGDKLANSLRALQDKLDSFNIDTVKSEISRELGANFDDIFIGLDRAPVAAASVSQVHRATLSNGEEVAVKILRPNIDKVYARDIKLLHFLADKIARFTKKYQRLRLKEAINIFEQVMHNELDLRLEAAACDEMRNNFSDDLSVYIPKIHWQQTAKNILVSEWIYGVSIYDTEKIIAMGLSPVEISRKFAVLFFNQVYRDGFFHADLHPGNILIGNDGAIILFDFGIVGRIKEKDRLAIAEIFYAFTSKDYMLVAKVHHRVGYIPKDADLESFAQNCRAVCEPIIGLAIKDISIGKVLGQLFLIAERFGMEMQPQLLLLQKTMLVVEGIGHSLNEDINMWQLAEPWIKKWAAKNLSPEARILRLIKKVVKDFSSKFTL